MRLWSEKLQYASTEQELIRAMHAVPVARGVVRYEALDETIASPACPTPIEVIRQIRHAQQTRPHLWSRACFQALHTLCRLLAHPISLRERWPRPHPNVL